MAAKHYHVLISLSPISSWLIRSPSWWSRCWSGSTFSKTRTSSVWETGLNSSVSVHTRQKIIRARDMSIDALLHIVTVSTCAGALCLLTAMMGFSGILLNNRAFLGFYTLFLWFCLALIVAPGYITYKKKTFNLEGKINAQWSRDLGLDGRVRIQNQVWMQHLALLEARIRPRLTHPLLLHSSTAAVITHPSWKRSPRILATLDRSYLVANRNT